MDRQVFNYVSSSTVPRPMSLIGLKAVRQAVDNIVSEAHLYRLGARHPHPFMIPLNKGEGRTTVSRYITDQFKAAHILRFEDCLEDLLEHEIDGTIQHLYQVFADIAVSADYANKRHGIDTFDLTGIASYEDDYLKNEFIKRVVPLCRTAGVVFYISEKPAPREEILIARLREAVPSIRRFAYEPYNNKELVAIAVKILLDKGIVIPDKKVIEKELLSAYEENDVISVKEAITIADEMVGLCTQEGERLWLKADAIKKQPDRKGTKREKV